MYVMVHTTFNNGVMSCAMINKDQVKLCLNVRIERPHQISMYVRTYVCTYVSMQLAHTYIYVQMTNELRTYARKYVHIHTYVRVCINRNACYC